jgi:DNA helicase HerA-like ATPase
MTLARRGRKFGLGIGIATQRIRFLDTSILAQPHTYFVSKLPRSSDRQAVAEAFDISEDMFRQTFKFRKGDWLLASFDAAGLEAIPVPIHTENADDKNLGFCSQIQQFYSKCGSNQVPWYGRN